MLNFIPRQRLSLHHLIGLPSIRNRPPAHYPALLNRKSMGTLLGDWKLVESPDTVAHQVFTKPIVKSEQDDRDYRIIQLENGLQVALVHDAKADKAAASLDVAVGHLYDPVCIPRLTFKKLF